MRGVGVVLVGVFLKASIITFDSREGRSVYGGAAATRTRDVRSSARVSKKLYKYRDRGCRFVSVVIIFVI